MEDEIINNLAETEGKLLEANNSLLSIKKEYTDILNNKEVFSFFNLDNIYFYFLLLGLILLAFSLWFLLSTLKQKELGKDIKKEKSKKIEEIEKPEKEKILKKKKVKAIKVKVLKIK